MSISVADVKAKDVGFTETSLSVELIDGRSISVPLEWYPRLLEATSKERNNWRLLGNAEGIHWPDLDEDISVESLLQGKRSGENQSSFERWLRERTSGVK